MRKIKYRGWNGKQLLTVMRLYLYIDGAPWWSDDSEELTIYNPEYSPLMQYTGLKDKNGKEIYEGDIVKLASGAYSTVTWDEDIDTDRYWWLATGFSIYIEDATGSDDMETLEIIGNIYENLFPGETQEKERR